MRGRRASRPFPLLRAQRPVRRRPRQEPLGSLSLRAPPRAILPRRARRHRACATPARRRPLRSRDSTSRVRTHNRRRRLPFRRLQKTPPNRLFRPPRDPALQCEQGLPRARCDPSRPSGPGAGRCFRSVQRVRRAGPAARLRAKRNRPLRRRAPSASLPRSRLARSIPSSRLSRKWRNCSAVQAQAKAEAARLSESRFSKMI